MRQRLRGVVWRDGARADLALQEEGDDFGRESFESRGRRQHGGDEDGEQGAKPAVVRLSEANRNAGKEVPNER